MLTIINYGCGNIGSISNMLKKLSINHIVASSPEKIMHAGSLILPGVGHFREGMRVLSQEGWIPVLNQKVLVDRIPILGICLGMQLMTNHSEEGNVDGLGWIDGRVKKFIFSEQSMKIPHMGWNEVITNSNSPLFEDFNSFEDIRFYHVHSYYVTLNKPELEISKTIYGFPFTSSFQKENIFGVQFHPEKSHKYGLKVLSNFSKISNA